MHRGSEGQWGSLWKDGRRGNSIIVNPPTCSPTQSGHCQSSGSERIQRAGLRVPPSLSFQCIAARISNSFTFNHGRLPAPLYPKLTAPPRVHTHHFTHLMVGAQLRVTICFEKKMASQLHCVHVPLSGVHQKMLNCSPCSPPPPPRLSLSV